MELLKRCIIAIIFIPLLLWVYYNGGVILSSLLGILCVVSAYELLKLFGKKDIKLLSFNVILSLALFYTIIYDKPYLVLILFLSLLFNGLNDVFLSKMECASSRLAYSLLLIIYPAIGFGYLYKISEISVVLLPVIAVLIWLTDSFAYFIGMTLGKHRGFFKCSPKKSIEGFVAGIATALIGSIVAYVIFDDISSYKMIAYLAVSVGFFGQFGDLFESIIKRDIGVKDSSNLIPGHGGILDRFDSLLIAAPVFYLLLKML
ncbi:MAG: phosphatidate cytidylyltransferase [Candidatus Cloacimonetes bacterium]|jgi:phosphatidate cytidylyltransferase|nr:phosphatidate cytidylyltransferase [Candidatus Cloacimonadota bacterium]